MPQMAPIWWTFLFLTFIITYMTVMMMLYFYDTYKIKTNPNKSQMKNMNWKW